MALKAIHLENISVHGSLHLGGSRFREINLTSAQIKGLLHINGRTRSSSKINTTDSWTLKLTGSSLGGIADHHDGWPKLLHLHNFSFGRSVLHGGSLGNSRRDEDTPLLQRDLSWMLSWLEKDCDGTTQPYEFLALKLSEIGQKDKAKDLLFHRALVEWKDESTGIGAKIVGAFSLVFIGFGYRIHYALAWVVALWVIGAWLAYKQDIFAVQRTCSGTGRSTHRCLDAIVFSLDFLLPVVELDRKNYEDYFPRLEARERYYFYFHRLMGFALASFVIAGLSGFVK